MGGKFKFHLKKGNIHNWQLILILIPMLFLTASFMRLDYQKMLQLRENVEAADEAGDNDATSAALEELASFTRKNIIVNIVEENGEFKLFLGTGPFYLKGSYRRDAEKAIEEATSGIQDDSNQYGNIYAAAMNVCKPQAIANGWTWSSAEYVGCMTGEIEKYPASEDLVSQFKANIPSTELYRREYNSKLWTLSFSGVMILLCLILSVVIIIRIFIWVIIRLSLLFL